MSDQPAPSREDGWVHRTVGPRGPVEGERITYGEGFLDLLPDGIAMLDRDLRVLGANRAFRRLLGLDYLLDRDAPTLQGRADLKVTLPNEPETRPLERMLRLAESIGLPMAIDGVEISLPRSFLPTRCSLAVIPGQKRPTGRAPLLVWIRPAHGVAERFSASEVPWPTGVAPRDLITPHAFGRPERFAPLPPEDDEPRFPASFEEYMVLALPLPACLLTADFNVRETNAAIGRMLAGSDFANAGKDRFAFGMFPELASPDFRRALEECRNLAEPRSVPVSLRLAMKDGARFEAEAHPIMGPRGDVRQILLAFHAKSEPPQNGAFAAGSAPGRSMILSSDPWERVILSLAVRHAGYEDVTLARSAGHLSAESLAAFDLIAAGDACDPELIRASCGLAAALPNRCPIVVVAGWDDTDVAGAGGVHLLPLLGKPGHATDASAAQADVSQAAQSPQWYTPADADQPAQVPDWDAPADVPQAAPAADDDVARAAETAGEGEQRPTPIPDATESPEFDWGSLGMFTRDIDDKPAEDRAEKTPDRPSLEESFVTPPTARSHGDRGHVVPSRGLSSSAGASSPMMEPSREISDLLVALDLLWDFRKLCDKVLDMALVTSGGKSGSLMLLDEDAGELKIIAAQGLSDIIAGRTRQRMGEGIAGLVAETGDPLLLQGRVGDNRFRGMGGRPQVGSSLVVPIRVGDRIIGVLNVTAAADGPKFTDADLAKMVGIGQQVGLPIDRSLEIGMMSRRSFELAVRKEIEQIVTGGGTMVERLHRVATSVRGKLDAESFLIYLLDEKKSELSLQVAAGLSLATPGAVKVPMGVGLVGHVAETLTPSVLTTCESSGESGAGLNHTTIAVPIRHLTQLVGVVALETTSMPKTRDDYLDRAMSVVSAVGHYLGDAWGREDSEERLTMISAVGEMAVSFSSASDLRALARLVAFCASPVLGGDVAVVRFEDGGGRTSAVPSLQVMGVEGVSFPSEGDPLVELDDCLATAVRTSTEPRKDSDLPDELRRQLLRRANVGAALSVPILDDERLVGTIAVYKTLGTGRDESNFGVREMEAGTRIADFAAAAATKHLGRPNPAGGAA